MTPPPPRRRPPSDKSAAGQRRPAAQNKTAQNKKATPARSTAGKSPAGRSPSGKSPRRSTAAKADARTIGRWVPALAAIAVLLVVVAAGTVSGDDKRGIAGADDAPISGSTTVPTGTVPTGETTSTVPGVNADPLGYNVTGLTVPVSTIPALATAPSGAPIVKTSLASSLYIGTSGPDVTALQNRLTELGFVPGKIDGYFGQMTREAVWAYEKLILQTPSDKATGKVTNTMWQGMQDSIVVQPRRSGSGTHVEIYLPQQVAAVFTDDKATLVIHISSGAAITSQRTPDNAWCETIHLDTDENGQPLDPPLDKPVCGIAYTPGGVFTFKRELQGDHVGPLGGMYNPVYFNYGIAMHGAKKVPLTPASHGCIRMNETISNTFQNFVHIHDRVYVWGWDGKEPEQYTKRESTPIFNFDDPNATTTTSTTIKTTTTTAKPTATTAKPTTETTTKAPTTTTTVKAAPTTTTTPAPTTTAAPATTAAAATQTTAAPSG